jgi:hypothetical protein
MRALLLFLLGGSVIASLMGVIASALAAVVLFRLRTTHSVYWSAGGPPSLIRWLWHNGYSDLRDSRTVRLSRIVKALLVVFVVGEVASLLGMLYMKGSL